MAAKTFNVGVVGYGYVQDMCDERRRLTFPQPLGQGFPYPLHHHDPAFKLHSIVQRQPKEGNSAPQDYPDAKHYTDAKALLADAEVHVVVITTPPDSHFALTKAAIEAGKHVLTEKPFVPTSAEADELMALAEQKQRLICVFQNRRWDADFSTIRRLVANQTLGRIIEFNSHFDRYRPSAPSSWKGELGISSGGSALFDLGTHLVDQVYVIFGMPQTVHGRLMSQRSARAAELFNPDSIAVQLTYPGGMLVHVRTSILSAETVQPRFWIRGSKGSFHKHGLDPQEDQLRAGWKPTHPDFGKEGADRMRLVLIDDSDGTIREAKTPEIEPETYRAFYAAFSRAAESGRAEDLPVKPVEARDVLRILEAVVESARTGRDVALVLPEGGKMR